MRPRLAWAMAIGGATAVAVACAFWIRANQLPSYYDEALYAIFALIDAWAARTYGLSGAYHAMIAVDPSAPPAMRALALPFTMLASPSLTLLRSISLAGLFAAAAIAAAALKRTSGELAAALAFLYVIALPITVLSTRMFSTEYPLFISVVAVSLKNRSDRAAPLLALSVGLGLLSKTSYAVIATPMLAVAAYAMPERRRAIAFGAVAGLALSLVWWSHDPVRAIRFGVSSGDFVRHALGRSLARWAWEFIRCDFGIAVAGSIAICATAIHSASRATRQFALICISGAVPLLVMHAMSVNHNPRLIAVPAVLMALAAAAFAPALPRERQSAAIFLAALQILLMVIPWHPNDDQRSYIWRGVTEVMAPVEQWDWGRLHSFADSRGAERPAIAMLGDGYAFNPPQIRYAWPELNGMIPVEPLYDWTEGMPFDLQSTIDRAAAAQLVVTAPGYRGEESDGQVPNNRYNAGFAQALARDARFEGPFMIDVGTRRPTTVAVFFVRH